MPERLQKFLASAGVASRRKAEELIRVPSERAGKPLGPYSDQILDLAGLFPFFIQMACCHAIEHLEENPKTRQPDFVEVRRRFYEEAKFHYRYIWEGLDRHERSAIVRVAERKGVAGSSRQRPTAAPAIRSKLEWTSGPSPDSTWTRALVTWLSDRWKQSCVGTGWDSPASNRRGS